MLSLKQILEIVSQITHDEYKVRVGLFEHQRPFLQVHCDEGICNVTGQPLAWSGRKWVLSYHMTPSEIVQTALKACLTAAEHECREKFKYKGITLFDPHIDLDKMVELRLAAGIKERDAA